MVKIMLSEVFGNNIFTRKSISNFFEELNERKDSKIEIDFSSIDFISRSCADEYIRQKKETLKEITETNMSKNICLMFDVVKAQHKKAGISVSFDICTTNHNECLIA